MNTYKLNAHRKELIWGTEDWLLSTHKSVVSFYENSNETKPVTEVSRGDLPVLVKIIDAKDTLSIQLHPDDEYAMACENDRGKTECWYILDADDQAELILGVEDTATEDNIAEILRNDRMGDHVRKIKIKRGDFIFIPPGTVHAIMGGTNLLEIQQSSNVTYRVHDWGRGRETHVEKAIETVKLDDESFFTDNLTEYTCDYFGVYKFEVVGSLVKTYGKKDVFAYVLDGEGSINDLHAKAGDSFYITDNKDVLFEGNMTVITSDFEVEE